MKIGDSECSADQVLLGAQGAVAAAAGAAMMAKPAWTQDQVLKSAGSSGGVSGAVEGVKERSNTMTRLAGSAWAISGSYAIAAGCSEDKKVQKTAAKIIAAHNAAGVGAGLLQLSGKEGDRSMDTNKIIGVTSVAALNCALMAWRGFRKDEDDK